MKNLKIPIFPLNGAILFPQTNLPLNIFEKRYLKMVEFAFKSDRLIAMIQKDKNGKFYSTGCIGKINSFSETEDGRYIINLIGQNYFTINKIPKEKNEFITAEVEIIIKKEKNENDLESFNKNLLIDKYAEFVNGQGVEIDLDIVKKISNSELIKFVAMSCSFSTEDKQMLLETPNLYDLGNKLISLFEFYHEPKTKKSLN